MNDGNHGRWRLFPCFDEKRPPRTGDFTPRRGNHAGKREQMKGRAEKKLIQASGGQSKSRRLDKGTSRPRSVWGEKKRSSSEE